MVMGNLTFRIALVLEDHRSGTLVGVLKGEDFLDDFCFIFRELCIFRELLVFGQGDWEVSLEGDWGSSSSSSSLVTKIGPVLGGEEGMVPPDSASSDAEGVDGEAEVECVEEVR